MSLDLGLAVLQPDYRGERIPVMEHFSAIGRDAIIELTGLDPVADHDLLEPAWDKIAEVLEVDLLWGGPLASKDASREIFDWTTGGSTRTNREGKPVVQWGIFHASLAEDGRHFHHIPKPNSVDEALDLDPSQWFPETVDELHERFQKQHDDYLARNGDLCYTLPCWYTTAFHFALAIFGFELLCFAGSEEDRFARLMERFVAISERVTTAWSRVKGLKGMILHDDLTMSQGPLFRPEWYRKHIFSHYPRIFKPLIDADIPIQFTSDGDCSMFADDIFAAGADGMNFEYLVDLETLVKNHPNKVLIGNLNSHTLAMGSKSRIEDEVTHCMEVGAKAPRFVVNVGGGITHDISPDNLLFYLDLRKRLARTVRATAATT
jgi:hypothetical protein